MPERNLYDIAASAHTKGKRLVGPMMFLPGLQIINHSIRDVLDDAKKQFEAIETLVRRYSPDIIFPFMNLSLEAHALGAKIKEYDDEAPGVDPRSPSISDLSDLSPIRNKRIADHPRVQTHLSVLEKITSAYPDSLKATYLMGPFSFAMGLTGGEILYIVSQTRGIKPEGIAILELATEKLIDYSKELEKIGVDIIFILEPLMFCSFHPNQYWELSGQYTKQIVDSSDCMVVLHDCGKPDKKQAKKENEGFLKKYLRSMQKTGVEGLSVCDEINMNWVGQILSKKYTLVGNIKIAGECDPRGKPIEDPQKIHNLTIELLKKMKNHPAFILSSQCRLSYNTPFSHIDAFFRAARDYNKQ